MRTDEKTAQHGSGTRPPGGVLAGLKVLEFAAIGPVPWCGMLLADLGASLVQVARPDKIGQRDTLGAVNRGRQVVVLDLKSAQGVAAALRLVEQADVLLEGLRPGVMERLGLGPDDCRARNPRLVYGRMTGWGQSGPRAQQVGHDINYIALSGVLHAIGPAERPVPPLNLVGDFGGGGALLAIGLLSALWQARATGRGSVVDAAMVDGSALLMSTIFSRMQLGQWQDRRASNALDGGVPWYDTYAAGDGRFVAVGALEQPFYEALLEGLGLTGHVPDRGDPSCWPHLRRRFAEVFATRTRDEWAAHFASREACVSPVLSMTEAMGDPHLQARGSFARWGEGQVPAAAPVFDGERPALSPPSRQVVLEEALQAWAALPAAAANTGQAAGPS
jgi:alpha-methylacyl-CoA racemase